MNIDLKTLSVIVSLLLVVVAGGMGYGSLKTEVATLKATVGSRKDSDLKTAADIMSIKTDVATLLERTKPK